MSKDLESLLAAGRTTGDGIAQLVDVDDGTPEVVRLLPLEVTGGTAFQWHLDAQRPTDGADRNVLWVDTRSHSTVARCDLPGIGVRDCAVDIVQTGAVAFTRNQPIIETPVLGSTTVLCIGIGSGGSIVVDQLARAGVGKFVLWDMDRIEAHNVGRHVCTLQDIGRRKTLAVRDHLLNINPAANIEYVNHDVLQASSRLEEAVAASDCVIVGTDNNASRFMVNEVAWRQGKVALYGRAFTRACGGDVIQVIPSDTPCFACHVSGRVVREEISSSRDAERVAYADAPVPIEPGLVIDIHPIANMVARLALLRLCASVGSPLGCVAEETCAPLYLWANRREGQFEGWEPMGHSYDRLSIFRWYAIGVPRDEECPTCSTAFEI